MKENEIRKKETLDRYFELVKKDVKAFFKYDDFVKVKCPACDGKDHSLEFMKDGFNYVMCRKCSTLFVNPRPPFGSLKKFYSDSESGRFWIDEFFRPVAEIRREKIFEPRAQYISKMLGKDKGRAIGDIGAGFGLFLEELRKIMPDDRYVAIEPSVQMADICRKKDLDVECRSLEDMEKGKESFDLLTAFELVEHLYDPLTFFRKIHSLLKPGGYLFLTTLNGMGFDIALLWEHSRSIAPPQHLNFFNTLSIRMLLERLDFEIVEISTPGRLDWDIVEGMIKNENVNLGRLWRQLAYESTEECKKRLQGWISENNLSSHMRVIARKRAR